MEVLNLPLGKMIYETASGAFPLGMDSMVLADFVRLRAGWRIADFGAGCGLLGLLLCGSVPGCTVDGIELQEAPHRAALENIRRNRLDGRLSSTQGDLREAVLPLPPGAYDAVVSNPPYFSAVPGGSPERTELSCPLPALFDAARRALRFGGLFFLVHRPERLTDLIWEARRCRLEPKRLQFVRHRQGTPASLVLLACRLGSAPGLQTEPDLVLYDADSKPTPACRRIYHQGGI